MVKHQSKISKANRNLYIVDKLTDSVAEIILHWSAAAATTKWIVVVYIVLQLLFVSVDITTCTI